MGSLSNPNIYLGAKLNLMSMDNGVVACSLSPLQYIQEVVKNKEKYAKDNIGDRWKIPKTSVNPFPCGYEPPLDVSQNFIRYYHLTTNPRLGCYTG